MKFLVFQHIDCEHPGIFRDLMEADGVSWDVVELDQQETIPNLDGYDALLVMGGPMDVWQKQANPWLIDELATISSWVKAGRPYLGFCLGHQLLAEAMGGTVELADQPEIGVMPVRVNENGRSHWFFRDCPDEIVTLQWHSAEVTRLPALGIALVESDFCKVNAMAWGECAVSVQFHVELTDHTVAEWGDIQQYANALDNASGPGAMAAMQIDADRHMDEFNSLSTIFYRNFVEMIHRTTAR